jgi:molybdopterin molybdotransferase
VIGEAPAGRAFAGAIGPGETVRPFTGGLLPDGADAVALQENATREGDLVVIEGCVTPGRFVREAGLDYRQGEVGLAAGRRLGARDLGLAASMGRAWLEVRRRPRIGLLATGDELVMPGITPGPAEIVSSNTPTLAAMLRAWGAEPLDLGIARDEAATLARALSDTARLDLIVTTGGASVGEHDLVQQALGDEGLALDFWKIAMRPGKPLIFGRLRGVPLLGLPGNPVSAGVCAVVFLRAAVRAMLGLDAALPETRGVLETPLGENDQRQEYLRATTRRDADGRLLVRPAWRQDSSMLATFARADALIVREPFAPAMPPGTMVRVVLLDEDGMTI